MKKATHETNRLEITDHQQIINVGPAMAGDFRNVNLDRPVDLIGKDPFDVYQLICKTDGNFHDPCVLDCVWSAIDFMNGQPPRKWWDYTPKRKKVYGDRVAALRAEFA